MHCRSTEFLLHRTPLKDTPSPQRRTPLDESSVGRRDLYLTTQTPHNTQTTIKTAGLEPTFLAGDRFQTDVLDGAPTGISYTSYALYKLHSVFSFVKFIFHESRTWRVLRSGQGCSTCLSLPEASVVF
jgi:hypothetical protein